MGSELPHSVVAFVRAHIDHVVKLRFLLEMHAAPSGTTTIPVIARVLDVPKNQVRDMAAELVNEGLVRQASDRLELAPSIDDRLALADLAAFYKSDRNAVIELLRALGRV